MPDDAWDISLNNEDAVKGEFQKKLNQRLGKPNNFVELSYVSDAEKYLQWRLEALDYFEGQQNQQNNMQNAIIFAMANGNQVEEILTQGRFPMDRAFVAFSFSGPDFWR